MRGGKTEYEVTAAVTDHLAVASSLLKCKDGILPGWTGLNCWQQANFYKSRFNIRKDVCTELEHQ